MEAFGDSMAIKTDLQQSRLHFTDWRDGEERLQYSPVLLHAQLVSGLTSAFEAETIALDWTLQHLLDIL